MSKSRFGDVAFVGIDDTSSSHTFKLLTSLLRSHIIPFKFSSNTIEGMYPFHGVIATPPLNIMRNSFTIKMDCVKNANFLVGVTTDTTFPDKRMYVGHDEQSWSKCSYGPFCYHSGAMIRYGDLLEQGNIITTIVHFNDQSLEFVVDGKSLGKVFIKEVDIDKPLYPAVSSYNGVLQFSVTEPI
jgi:hypothetical protein